MQLTLRYFYIELILAGQASADCSSSANQTTTILGSCSSTSALPPALRAMQLLRLMRILKLLRHYVDMRVLMLAFTPRFMLSPMALHGEDSMSERTVDLATKHSPDAAEFVTLTCEEIVIARARAGEEPVLRD